MKLILSRKGFDSGYGGVPSPILPDGRIVPLPIPSRSRTRVGDVHTEAGPLAPIVEALTRGRIRARTPIHLDPDLAPHARPRLPGWRPAFGQTGAAQSHLERHGVGPGDLFLFFGWFREAEERDGALAWRPGPGFHMIFGWLEVGEVLRVGRDSASFLARYPFLAGHPHLEPRWDDRNTVYLASHRLCFGDAAGLLPGGGLFPRFDPRLVLTAPGQRCRSLWRLPGAFHPDGRRPLSYHGDPGRWQKNGVETLLRAVPRGQEFVLDLADYPELRPWIGELLAAARP